MHIINPIIAIHFLLFSSITCLLSVRTFVDVESNDIACLQCRAFIYMGSLNLAVAIHFAQKLIMLVIIYLRSQINIILFSDFSVYLVIVLCHHIVYYATYKLWHCEYIL